MEQIDQNKQHGSGRYQDHQQPQQLPPPGTVRAEGKGILLTSVVLFQLSGTGGNKTDVQGAEKPQNQSPVQNGFQVNRRLQNQPKAVKYAQYGQWHQSNHGFQGVQGFHISATLLVFLGFRRKAIH